MKDEHRLYAPAAFPLLAFALALGLTPSLIGPGWGAVAAWCIAILSLGARPLRRFGAALTALAIGATLGSVNVSRMAADESAIRSLGSGRFVTVRVPLERAWDVRDGQAVLRARSFRVESGEEERPIDARIVATLWDAPPSGGSDAAFVRLEGFLHPAGRGYRLSVKSRRLASVEGSLPLWSPTRWNRAAAERVRKLGEVSERARRGSAMVRALALGDGEGLDDDVREAYRRGGTYHLLVFSGMQIAFAAGAISWCFRRLGRPTAGDVVLLLIAFLAPPFAGHDPSVSRSSLMIGLYACSRLLGRPTPIENLLFVSAAVRLILHPSDLGEPGFALTYAATGGLILIGRGLSSAAGGSIGRAIAYGAGAEAATTPVTALFFNQWIVGSSIVTILLSPLLTVMLGASAIAAALAFVLPDFAVLLLEWIGRGDEIAVAANLALADRFHLSRVVSAPPSWVVALCLVAAMVLVLRRGGSAAAAAACCVAMAPLLVGAVMESARGAIDAPVLDLLDVGQGEAVLLRDGRSAVLIDGGGRFGQPRFGREVLIPLLLERGVRRLDAVVLTHPDPDHCDGLLAVLEELTVAELRISSRHFTEPCGRSLLDLTVRRGIPVILADRAPRRAAGTLPIELFAAPPPFRRSVRNNTSLVLRVRLSRRTILLTGDIERAAELKLLEAEPQLGPCDILKVAHHGSSGASADSFLERTSPKAALVSCGMNNRFGHPSPEVVERLSLRGVRLYRTDLHGSIRVRLPGRALLIEREIDLPGRAGTLEPLKPRSGGLWRTY